jgi:hypothetical protein
VGTVRRVDRDPTLIELVRAAEGEGTAALIAQHVAVHPLLAGRFEPHVLPRAVIAEALNLVALARLVGEVPSAAAYLADRRAAGARIVLDHGAVRTVAWPTAGALPLGHEQVARFLEPLGYRCTNVYPLSRLRMTGRSYTHLDLPAHVGQWFVSELHPDTFSPAFQMAVERVLASSRDPLAEHPVAAAWLEELGAGGTLPFAAAAELVAVLAGALGRLHDPPDQADYRLLAAESAEMAWIATEGTTFNHATDRVADVEATAGSERAAGRPIKDTVEVSASGRVRQTAHRAHVAARTLGDGEGGHVTIDVPTSFFEFISRAELPDGTLDLGFDAANAQGIFAMTTPAAGDPPRVVDDLP